MKNNKGVTLIELIIAISIMSIVIGLGNNVINKVNSATKNQNKISENQLNANLINKYLTKDLENCKTFEEPEGDNLGEEYQFIIKNKDGNEIIYKVSTEKKRNQEVYNLTRSNNGSEIDLITNQPKVSEIPFFISEKEGYDDLYVVELDSSKEVLGKYRFEVASRALVSSSKDEEIPVSPEEDDSSESNKPVESPIIPDIIVPGNSEDEFDKEQSGKNLFHIIKLWVKDVDSTGEMGFSHSGDKHKGLYEKSKPIIYGSDNRYLINIKMVLSNSSPTDYMSIKNGGNTLEIEKDDKLQVQNLGKNQDLIVIEVNEGTIFELEVNDTFEVPNVSSGKKIILKTGKYRYNIKSINNKKDEFIVTGSIIKNTENAEVKVYYGQKKK